MDGGPQGIGAEGLAYTPAIYAVAAAQGLFETRFGADEEQRHVPLRTLSGEAMDKPSVIEAFDSLVYNEEIVARASEFRLRVAERVGKIYIHLLLREDVAYLLPLGGGIIQHENSVFHLNDAFQLLYYRVTAHLQYGLVLDLPYPLPGNPEDFSDLFEGKRTRPA